MANRQIVVLEPTTDAGPTESVVIRENGDTLKFMSQGAFTGVEKAILEQRVNGDDPMYLTEWAAYTQEGQTPELNVDNNVMTIYLELGEYRLNKDATTNAVGIVAMGGKSNAS